MYDISIFPKRNGNGLMQEAEIAFFDEEFLKSMVPLINMEIGLSLKQFFKDFDDLPKIEHPQSDVIIKHVELMKTILDERIRMVTVPAELRQRDVWNKLVTRFPKISELSQEERMDTMNDINYILENKDVMIEVMPARNKDDYARFIYECSRIEDKRNRYLGMYGDKIPHLNATENFVDYVKDSELFYSVREQSYNTGAKIFMRQIPMIERFKHGIEFTNQIRSEKIPVSLMRTIKF